MMESVAISDVEMEQNDSSEDYVLVDHASDMTDEDDDSYDYCEMEYDDDDDDDDEEMDNLHHPSIFSVPHTLMKDLDDAHAAAELVRITTEPIRPNSSEERKPSIDDGATTAVATQSTDIVKAGKTTSSMTTSDEVEPSPPPPPPPEFVVQKEKTDKRKESEQGYQQEESAVPSKVPTVTMSRSSNKKRRKKLKMMKKQQAAMNAAEALEARAKVDEITARKSTLSAKTAAKHVSSQRITSRSKKGSNLAVVCATETLAAYRQELVRKACT